MLLAGIGLALAISVAPARAQDASANARSLFEEGVALAETQAWREAAERFRASLALEPRASTLFNLAVTLFRLEHHAELLAVATRYLELNDPTRSESDRAEIERLRAKALERVARVRIAVTPERAEVRLDGVVLERAALADDVVLDPGVHDVAARAEGFTEQRVALEARAGERASMHLRLTPIPAVALPSPALAPTAPVASAHTQRDDGEDDTLWSSPWLWLGVGAGAAIIATTAIVLLSGSESEPPPDYGRMMF